MLSLIFVLFPLTFIVLIGSFLKQNLCKRNTDRNAKPQDGYNVGGTVQNGFERVKQTFVRNLALGWEPCGAALCVFHRGRLVADLWGGWADAECARPWRAATLNLTFSSTKAVAALCVARLVELGRLDYDAPLVRFWPAFGKHGKHKVTVQQVLSHMAGLPYFDHPITYEDCASSTAEAIARAIEDEVPKFAPGAQIAYHALTYGWLLDQIVRRADAHGRSLGQFYREEVRANVGDVDYFIGLPKSEFHRVSRLRLPTFWQRVREFWLNPGGVYYWRYFVDFLTGGPLSKVNANFPWLQFIFEMSYNNPDLWSLEQGAVLGIGTAKGLATLFQRGCLEGRVVGERTLRKMFEPYTTGEDAVTGACVTRGNGLMFTEFKVAGTTQRMVGHAGVGGQNVKMDAEHGLCFAYVSNGFKCGFGDSAPTFVALRDAIYESVLELERRH